MSIVPPSVGATNFLQADITYPFTCKNAIWFKNYCGYEAKFGNYEFTLDQMIQYEQVVLNSYGDATYVKQ